MTFVAVVTVCNINILLNNSFEYVEVLLEQVLAITLHIDNDSCLILLFCE